MLATMHRAWWPSVSWLMRTCRWRSTCSSSVPVSPDLKAARLVAESAARRGGDLKPTGSGPLLGSAGAR
jgi:hypothetical protein